MTNVFFRGHGRWVSVDEDQDGPYYPWSSEPYETIGVFRLTEDDETEYKLTEETPDADSLLPSTPKHPEDELSTALSKGLMDSVHIDYPNLTFFIDKSKFYKIKILADEPTQTESIGNSSKVKTPSLIRDEKRNNVAKKWVEEKEPKLQELTNKEILKELEVYNKTLENHDPTLFLTGAKDWFDRRRDLSVIPRKKSGSKPSKPKKPDKK